MKVSYNWLKQYVDLENITPSELAERLTRSGIEVDAVEQRNKGVEKTVVGYVLDKTPHPDADKLNVCTVDAGTGEPLQIVCGAKNVDKGQKVPVALVGAVLPGDVKITRAKLRGVESQGMICSAKELGLSEKLLPKTQTEGILVLPENTEIGQSVVSLLGLDDVILELGLTPNRSDCLSMIGVAYEVAAIFDRKVKLPEYSLVETDQGETVSIEIKATKDCTRYAAKIVRNVRIEASPLWMQERLMAAGIRPINNIVDITNYVMLVYGQPLHAFDYEQLAGSRIVVRSAKAEELFVTLDDTERKLTEDMLLITDGEKPVAIAGVMGGANSEVSTSTKHIVIESAVFRGGSVRKTSRQLGLRSEASARFEKGVNPEAIIPALNYAAHLMSLYVGGEIESETADENLFVGKPNIITLRVERLNAVTGACLSEEEVHEMLERLAFDVTSQDQSLSVTVPSRRGDIFREEDLIEEVIRLYGYDNIPTTLPNVEITPGFLTRSQSVKRTISQLLVNLGWNETINYGLTHTRNEERIAGLHDNTSAIALALPMSEERSRLRSTLIPQLLEVAQYNKNRGLHDLALYELAHTFISEEQTLTKQPNEELVLAGILTGSRQNISWHGGKQPVDFYDLKGSLDHVLARLGAEEIRYISAERKGFHPGRTATIMINDTEIGFIGQLHPDVQQQFDLDDVFGYQISIAALLQAIPETEIAFTGLPKFPSVSRDMAIIVDRNINVGSIQSSIYEVGGDLLKDVSLFDVYEGDRIGENKKSLAFSLTYRSNEQTLTDEEVNTLHQKIIEKLRSQFDAQLRS